MSTPTQQASTLKAGVCCKATTTTSTCTHNQPHCHHHSRHQQTHQPHVTRTIPTLNQHQLSSNPFDRDRHDDASDVLSSISPSPILIIVAKDDGDDEEASPDKSNSPSLCRKDTQTWSRSGSPMRTYTRPIPSKLNNSWNQSQAKSFSFGPIPAPRRARCGRNDNYCNKYSTSSPLSISTSFCCKEEEEEEGQEDGNGNNNERCPLLLRESRNHKNRGKDDNYFFQKKNGNCSEGSRNEKFVMDSETTETEGKNRDTNSKTVNSNGGRKSYYTPQISSKERIVLEEIPYYVEESNCN
jgi:hypothetical protein